MRSYPFHKTEKKKRQIGFNLDGSQIDETNIRSRFELK